MDLWRGVVVLCFEVAEGKHPMMGTIPFKSIVLALIKLRLLMFK